MNLALQGNDAEPPVVGLVHVFIVCILWEMSKNNLHPVQLKILKRGRFLPKLLQLKHLLNHYVICQSNISVGTDEA